MGLATGRAGTGNLESPYWGPIFAFRVIIQQEIHKNRFTRTAAPIKHAYESTTKTGRRRVSIFFGGHYFLWMLYFRRMGEHPRREDKPQHGLSTSGSQPQTARVSLTAYTIPCSVVLSWIQSPCFCRNAGATFQNLNHGSLYCPISYITTHVGCFTPMSRATLIFVWVYFSNRHKLNDAAVVVHRGQENSQHYKTSTY